MWPTFASPIIFLFLWVCQSFAKCQSIEEMLETLDSMSDTMKVSRRDQNVEDLSPIWQEYEFETGAGNREELVVTNVSIHENLALPWNEKKWEFLEVKSTGYLASANLSSFFLYKFDLDDVTNGKLLSTEVDGRITIFKFFDTYRNNRAEIIAILCVKRNDAISLQWYRIIGNNFVGFWSWPVNKHVRDIVFVQYKNKSKLLLLSNDTNWLAKKISLIDVYGFSIDFSQENYDSWFSHKIIVPETYKMEVCRIHETPLVAFQSVNEIFVYEYSENANEEANFQYFQTIESNMLEDFVCFESGSFQYLAISGPEPDLFGFLENEYEAMALSKDFFNSVPEIVQMKDIRMRTYRQESLLLVQVRNSTVLALAWQGEEFKRIELPNAIVDRFDLSKITAIPRFGFVLGNTFVRIDTKLRDLPRLIGSEIETMMKTKALLKEVLDKQERVIDAMDVRIQELYHSDSIVIGSLNVTTLNATNVTIKDDVTYRSITINTGNLLLEDSFVNLTAINETLNDHERKLERMLSKLMLYDVLDVNNKTNVELDADIYIIGNLNVTGTLKVDKFKTDFLNGMLEEDVIRDCVVHDDVIVDGMKTVPSVEAEDILIETLNGIPIQQILFNEVDDTTKNYSGINFSAVNRMVIDGHLQFSTINGVDWKGLMHGIVWKNKLTYFHGHTVIVGTIVADEVKIDNLNGFHYPNDFLSKQYSKRPTELTGTKIIDELTVGTLLDIDRVNDVNINDFVLNRKHNVLNEEITFENLIIDGKLQIDGEIVGLNSEEIKKQLFINETNVIPSNLVFGNLTVLGNVNLEGTIDGKGWSNFDDILLKTDANAIVTGKKKFLNSVRIGSPFVIESNTINGHKIEDFMTVDTDQDLLNLNKISANVILENVTYGLLDKLEDRLKRDKEENKSGCSKRKIIFTNPVIVDEISFNTLNDNISSDYLNEKWNETLRTAYFEDLTVRTLHANKVFVKSINSINMTGFERNRVTTSTVQNITGNYTIDYLETDDLIVDHLNGMTIEEVNSLTDQLNMSYREILSGNVSFESVNVTGSINARSLNSRQLTSIYGEHIGDLILDGDVNFENLTVFGLVNGYNISEVVADAIMKNDENIVVSSYKAFDNINCQYLDVTYLNGHHIENLLNPEKEQVLKGPVIVNGTVNVLENFNTHGEINGKSYQELTYRFKPLGNNTFKLGGDFKFIEEVSIENLRVDGTIQGTRFDQFLESVIFRDNDNVTITGSKIFEGTVTFDDRVIISETLNDLDLKTFYETAVFINKPFSVKRSVIFLKDIYITKDLIVTEDLKAKSIMGVNIEALLNNVAYLDRPTTITTKMMFTNISFESGIRVEMLNDLDLRKMIPLHTDQILPHEVIEGSIVNAKDIEILGNINGYYLDDIYNNALMMTDDQNITGTITFHGNVHIRGDFTPRFMNNISPIQFVWLDTEDITGNFVFEEPIILNGSLRVLRRLNLIDPVEWEAVAVSTTSLSKQIVSGKWTIDGNVEFENGITGEGFFNEIDMTTLPKKLEKIRLITDDITITSEIDLYNICMDLNDLMYRAKNQIYKFDTFAYLQILKFDQRVISVHHFEDNELDYLLVSHDTCQMDVFQYTGTKFVLVDSVVDFGIAERWITLRFNNETYFLVIGSPTCGRNVGNLWKFADNKFMHVYNFGNVTDARKLNDDTFLILIDHNLFWQSIERINENSSYIASRYQNENVQFVRNSDRILLIDRYSFYELSNDFSNKTSWTNNFGLSEIISFKAGIFEREQFLLYNVEINEDYIFIRDGDAKQWQILQIITAQRPKSFIVINFEGLIETLLIFIDNDRSLQIYEYQGVQGFVYRDNIKMKAEKLFHFSIRKYANMAKRHCLGVIYKNRLTILEAQMHGEKLDMSELTCQHLEKSKLSISL